MDIGLSLALKTHSGAGAGGTPEPEPWYLAGGVALANCVAAYQAKGAADYATSKINLANSGTYDLTAVDGQLEPSWASLTGWSFNGSSMCLNTSLQTAQIPQMTSSFIGSYSGYSGEIISALFGSQNDDNSQGPTVLLTIQRSGANWKVYAANWDEYTGKASYSTADNLNSAILARTGHDHLFVNGIEVVDTPGSPVAGTIEIYPIYLGAYNVYWIGSQTLFYFMNGYIDAVAFYNTTLTAPQIAAITNAIQAL